MIPGTTTIISLLLMLSSMWPAWHVGGEAYGSPDIVPEGACGAYRNGVVAVDTDNYCQNSFTGVHIRPEEVLAHEIGHAVADKCMSEQDKQWFLEHHLGMAPVLRWFDGGIYYRASEQFADAFGQALTGFTGYNSGSKSTAVQNSALTFWARCVNFRAVLQVIRTYEVMRDRGPGQLSYEWWVGSIMRGDYTGYEAMLAIGTSSEYYHSGVSDLGDWQFIQHAFLKVHHRYPHVYSGEYDRWVRELQKRQRIHGKAIGRVHVLNQIIG